MHRNLVFFLLSLVLAGSGFADGWGGVASVTCERFEPGNSNTGEPPVLKIDYTPGSDAGMRGRVGIAILAPDLSGGMVLTDLGWDIYQGGPLPLESHYDNGLPAQITKQIHLPVFPSTTAEFQGHGIFVGHGVYPSSAKKMTAGTREVFENQKMEAEQESNKITDLIQQDAATKWARIFSIPRLDCTLLQVSSGPH